MDSTLQWFSIIVGLVVGVVLIVLFFDLRTWAKRKWHKTDFLQLPISPWGESGPVRIRLKDGNLMEGVRLLGVTDAEKAREAGVPHALTNLLVLEKANGAQVFVTTESVRWIEQLPVTGKIDEA